MKIDVKRVSGFLYKAKKKQKKSRNKKSKNSNKKEVEAT